MSYMKLHRLRDGSRGTLWVRVTSSPPFPITAVVGHLVGPFGDDTEINVVETCSLNYFRGRRTDALVGQDHVIDRLRSVCRREDHLSVPPLGVWQQDPRSPPHRPGGRAWKSTSGAHWPRRQLTLSPPLSPAGPGSS